MRRKVQREVNGSAPMVIVEDVCIAQQKCQVTRLLVLTGLNTPMTLSSQLAVVYFFMVKILLVNSDTCRDYSTFCSYVVCSSPQATRYCMRSCGYCQDWRTQLAPQTPPWSRYKAHEDMYRNRNDRHSRPQYSSVAYEATFEPQNPPVQNPLESTGVICVDSSKVNCTDVRSRGACSHSLSKEYCPKSCNYCVSQHRHSGMCFHFVFLLLQQSREVALPRAWADLSNLGWHTISVLMTNGRMSFESLMVLQLSIFRSSRKL
uniref:ShKT domain-containing protein n=1 Tax=Steinernema glaseri TaxID=37863 RepID=A0A1I7ZKI3_9BILA